MEWNNAAQSLCRLTISGFEAVHQTNGQVTFGSKFSSFLSHVDHHLTKHLTFIQLGTIRKQSYAKDELVTHS